MKVLIVEDETAAYENLMDILTEDNSRYPDHGKYGKCHTNRRVVTI